MLTPLQVLRVFVLLDFRELFESTLSHVRRDCNQSQIACFVCAIQITGAPGLRADDRLRSASEKCSV